MEQARIIVREPADADVIRKALSWYLDVRKRQYHRAAAESDTEAALQLSISYETDKEYICGLLRAVGDGTMAVPPSTGTESTQSKDNDDE